MNRLINVHYRLPEERSFPVSYSWSHCQGREEMWPWTFLHNSVHTIHGLALEAPQAFACCRLYSSSHTD